MPASGEIFTNPSDITRDNEYCPIVTRLINFESHKCSIINGNLNPSIFRRKYDYMAPINIIYISIEGNTRAFIKRLSAFAEQQHAFDSDKPLINAKEITDQTIPEEEKAPFFVFVPTYLTGGNGIDSGFTEIMTNALGEYIADGNSARKCIGVVGSGNRNFNEQYCLTARKYAKQFNAPFIADYELRGTARDAEHIYATLCQRWPSVNA